MIFLCCLFQKAKRRPNMVFSADQWEVREGNQSFELLLLELKADCVDLNFCTGGRWWMFPNCATFFFIGIN